MIIRHPSQWPQFDRLVKALKSAPIPKNGWDINWGEHSKRRSSQQNRYYHKVITPMVADWLERDIYPGTVWTKDMAHEVLKRKFLPEKEYPNGKMYGKSTTELSTEEFADYITQIQAYCAEYGLYIPDPNEGNHES